jgi:hypothetical protein
VVVPLLTPGNLSPEIIRQYQDFEFRKVAAGIFRRR